MMKLFHSAKGTSWKEHKYIKRNDGIYYYPDSYEGGRHWPPGKKRKSKGESDSDSNDSVKSIAGLTGMKESEIKKLQEIAATKGYDSPEYKELCRALAEGDPDTYQKITKALQGSGSKSNLEDWEVKMHKHIADIVEKHPDMFKTTDDVSKNIMAAVNTDAFKNTLKAITGKDPDKMSESELASMRRKISDYYTEGYKDSTSAAEPKKSSKKKKEDNKDSKKEDKDNKDSKKEDKKKEEKKDSKKDDKKKESTKNKNNGASGLRPYIDKLVYTGGKSGKSTKSISHHGLDNTDWFVHFNPYHDRLGRFAGSPGGSSSSSGRKGKFGNKRDTETMQKARKADINKLTTEEIREYNNRLNAEKQFLELTKNNTNAGKKWAKKVVVSAATSLATAALISAGKKYLTAEKILSVAERKNDSSEVYFKILD